MDFDEKQLIRTFKLGHEKAFEKVYQLLYRPLNLFAFSIISDMAQSQDIVTDSFIKIWHERRNFDNLAAIRSWLYTTTANRCKDHLRTKLRHERSHKEILYLSDETEASSERELIISGFLVELYDQLQLLPEQRRQIFELIWFEGKSTAEIARALNTSTKNVLNQKLKAVKELRSILLKKNLLPVFSSLGFWFALVKKFF